MRFIALTSLFVLFPLLARAQQHRIEVTPAGKGVYVHTSYGSYKGASVPSNGLLLDTREGVVLIDSPWGNEQTTQLLQWVDQHLKKKVILTVVTHAHADRMGGIKALREGSVRVVSTPLTALNAERIADEVDHLKPEPAITVDTVLSVAPFRVEVFYPGKGHAPDNVVVWLPERKLLFGGCFIKSTEATNLGNLADADVAAWQESLRKVMQKYPEALTIVPGHGELGDRKLLDHTMQLLQVGK